MTKSKFKVGDTVRVIRCKTIIKKLGFNKDSYCRLFNLKDNEVYEIIAIEDGSSHWNSNKKIKNKKIIIYLSGNLNYIFPEEMLIRV